MKGAIIEIDYQTAVNFLLPKHYSGRIPTISKAFGWYDCKTYTDEHLKAVCTLESLQAHFYALVSVGKNTLKAFTN